MDIIKIAGVVLIVVTLVNTLPTFSKEISALITIACCIVILLYIIKTVSPAIETIKTVADQVAFNGLEIIFKAVGTGLITQFVADIATDNGNKALANQMVFVGKIAIIVLAMPVFLQVMELIGQLII
ncbi:MAG: stage III sporulation AC/AD family protein [Oscillospiraceae bacterium]